MRNFDIISEEDITYYKEIDVTAMSRNDDKRAFRLSMSLNLLNGRFVNYDFLIDSCEYFMEEPSEQTNRTHRVITKHSNTNLLGYLGQLLFCLVV